MKSLFMLLPVVAFANPDKTITVHGQGEIKIKPDIAYISLLVRSRGKDAKSAQQKNAAEMSRVQKILREQFKIEERDLQTEVFSLSPEYRYEQPTGKQVFEGFSANHGLSVKVRKVDKSSEILDGIVGKGSEDQSVSLNGISFSTDNRKAYQVQALESAMNNAKERAEAIAKFAGRKIIGVLRVSDTQLVAAPARRMRTATLLESDSASAATPTQTGEIEVGAQVQVEYEME